MSSTSANRADNEHYIYGDKSSDLHTSINEFTEITYISNSNYFLRNPWHHDNNTDTGLNVAGVCAGGT